MSAVDKYIHPAKTFSHINGANGMLDIDAFLKKRLPSLLKDFRALHRRLASLSEASATYYRSRLEDTLRKVEETHTALERFDVSMHSILDAAFERMEEKYASLPELPSFPDIDLLPTLDDALASLEQKYSELESLDLAEALDQTAQRFADALEEVDARLVSTRDLVQARLESLKAQHIAPILSRAQGLRRRAMSTAQQTLSSAQQTLESTSPELADAFQRALTAGASRLLHYHELPLEWQENPYIHSGYRFLATPRECMCSIVAVHNETGNIWTHLLGFIVFAVLGYMELATQWGNLRTLPFLDRVVFGIFFVAACKCLACSTIWHTFAQIAHLETMKSMACVDYVGISVLICASVMVFEYYGFYASSWPRAIYLASTGILAITGIFVPFSAWFDKREYRFLRTVFFLALGTSAVVPVVHLIFLHGLNTVLLWLSPLLSSITCYLTGVFLYVNHYPEKIFPGWFDHVGNSHQLWHMCVVAGIWFHYRAGIRFVASPGVIGFPSVNTIASSSL